MPRRPPKPPPPPPKRHERGWGKGSVKEVSPGVWRAWRSRQRNAEGASVRPSATFRGPDAEARAKRWAAGETQPAVWLLGRWLDQWLRLRLPRLRPSSVYNYRRHFRSCGALVYRPLAEVTTDELQLRANELLAAKSWSEVNNWRGIVSAALKAAADRGMRVGNPMSGVVLPKPEDRPVRAWSANDVARLVAVARGGKHEAWLWLLIGTGVRLGESRGLKIADVDTVHRMLTITRSVDGSTNVVGPTKSGKMRTVAIPDEVIPIIVRHIATLPPRLSWLFPSPVRRGEPLTADSLRDWLTRICGLAGVEPATCHAARHTFASLALDAGVPLKEVSEALGHSNVAITARVYSHAVDRTTRRAANALGKVLSGTQMGPIREIGAENGTNRGG